MTNTNTNRLGPPMKIITSTNNDIRQISLNLHSTEVIQTTPSLNIIDFDVNAIDNYVYWTSKSNKFKFYILMYTNICYID